MVAHTCNWEEGKGNRGEDRNRREMHQGLRVERKPAGQQAAFLALYNTVLFIEAGQGGVK